MMRRRFVTNDHVVVWIFASEVKIMDSRLIDFDLRDRLGNDELLSITRQLLGSTAHAIDKSMP